MAVAMTLTLTLRLQLPMTMAKATSRKGRTKKIGKGSTGKIALQYKRLLINTPHNNMGKRTREQQRQQSQ
jgi:hypothetical protein